jgi:hypothetical protein
MADLTPNNREEYWLQGMVDGQTTLEPNTRREFWYKEIVDAIGSGGGGGTGGGVTIATGTFDEDIGLFILDKTFSEIKAAYLNGTVVINIQFGANNDKYFSAIGVRLDTTLGTPSYTITVFDASQESYTIFETDALDGYPSGYLG